MSTQTQPQKLNQLLAVEKATKGRVETNFTEVYHTMKKKGLFQGMWRIYSPKTDGGETEPEQRQHVQARVEDQFTALREFLGELFNLTATKDNTNTVAKADVIIDGVIILAGAPATHLLWLERKLTDLLTLVKEIPILDPAQAWDYDKGSNLWKTKPAVTNRTKKEFRPILLAPATDKHPAQVKESYEDVVVGNYEATHLSGALPGSRVEDLIRRVVKAQSAVKIAREQANMVPIAELKSSTILDYIFATK